MQKDSATKAAAEDWVATVSWLAHDWTHEAPFTHPAQSVISAVQDESSAHCIA
jgi:hypothetical protein